MMAIRKDGRGLTIGEAALLQATTWWSPRLVGTAETIADGLQDMFENNCCDGFIITQALSPGGLEAFVDLVVPVLHQRVIYRLDYAGRSFRENLAPSRSPVRCGAVPFFSVRFVSVRFFFFGCRCCFPYFILFSFF